MDSSLLQTKLNIPIIPTGWIPRPRLLEMLDRALTHKLTLLSAPAGYGKSTLLADWIHSRDLHAAWLSLGKGEDDFPRFLGYMIAALNQLTPLVDDSALRMYSAAQPGLQQASLTVLINQMARIPGEFILVLDDYHTIQEEAIHRAINYLLLHLPQQLHLMISSRSEPPLQIARLRGQGELIEFRADVLRFTSREVSKYFSTNLPGTLTIQQLAVMNARTEGWPAGLHLAAISLRDRHDIAGFIDTFSGSHRYILDYLLEEVLEKLGQEERNFLLQTSLLEGLSAPLCNAVTGRLDSQSILLRFEQANLFIIPLDEQRQWYRYHPLFADLLRNRLLSTEMITIRELHQRASKWYETNDHPLQAIQHALLAEDYPTAASLIRKAVIPALYRSEIDTLLGWFDHLPKEVINSDPNLHFLQLWVLLLKYYRIEEIQHQIAQLSQGNELLQARKAAVESFISVTIAEFTQGEAHAQVALRTLPEDEGYFRSIAMWMLGLARAASQNLEGAYQALEELVCSDPAQDNLMFSVLATSQMARVRLRQGRLNEAFELYHQSLERACDRQGNLLPIAGETLMGLGEYYRESDQLDKAYDLIIKGIEQTNLWRDVAALDGYISLARLYISKRELDEAEAALDKAMQLARKYDVLELDDRLVEMWRARLWIARGDFLAAERWAKELGFDRISNWEKLQYQKQIQAMLLSREAVIYARLCYKQGIYQRVLQIVNGISPYFQQLGRLDSVIELAILKSLTLQAQRSESQAIQAITEALNISASSGYYSLYLDEGQPLLNLLQKAAGNRVPQPYYNQLLARFAKPSDVVQVHPQPLADPLSERELDVLRLLATNLTAPEIAEELIVGVSTVRTHIKHIYSKLYVHKRSAAVEKAIELGIL
jgi:LuxR family maltose regulon positive regulatory protein